MTELEQLFSQWQDLQPINEVYSKRLKRKFMLEFNYNSNHIEGSRKYDFCFNIKQYNKTDAAKLAYFTKQYMFLEISDVYRA